MDCQTHDFRNTSQSAMFDGVKDSAAYEHNCHLRGASGPAITEHQFSANSASAQGPGDRGSGSGTAGLKDAQGSVKSSGDKYLDDYVAAVFKSATRDAASNQIKILNEERMPESRPHRPSLTGEEIRAGIKELNRQRELELQKRRSWFKHMSW